MATKAEMLKKKQQDAAALENARKIAKEHNEVLNTAKATLPSIKRPEFNAQNSVTTNSLKGKEDYNPTIMGLAQDLAQKKMFDPDTMQAVNPVSNTNETVGSGRKFGASNAELSPVTITDNMNGDMDDPENWPTADKVRNEKLLKSDLAELKAKMDANKTNPIENAVAFLPAVTGAAGKYAKAKQDAYKQAKKDYQDALVLQMNQAVRSEPGYGTMSAPVDDPARLEDPMYAVINGTNVLPIVGVGEIAKSLFTGANYTESKYMTADDRQTYNYIYNTRGKEAATEYYNALMPQLTEREFRDNFNKTSQRVSNTSGLGYAGSIVGSWAENAEHALLGVGDAVRQAGEYLFTGDIDKNDWQRYSITRTTEANTQGVSQHIMDKYKDDPKKAANMAKWGTFGYSTVQSIINSTIQALTGQSVVGLANTAGSGLNASGMLTETTANVASGKGAGMLFRSYLGEAESKKAQELALDIMATSAMPSATFEAMDRGIEAPKALLVGIIAGAAEWATEKMELKALFDNATLEQNVLKYLANNAREETLEEMASDIINLVADVLINLDQSELVQNYQTLKKGGYSFGEIVGMMAKEKAIDILMSGLGGFVSGTFTSGSQIATYKASNAYVGSRLAGNEASVIETGLNTDEGTLTNQLAKQLQEKQASGKKLSKEEIGRLAGLNAQAFQSKAAFDKADTAVERDLEMAGKQNEAILEAGMEADKNSQAYQLAQEMSSDQTKQTQENYYRLENLNQQEDAQLPESKKNASHNVAVAYQVQNDIETTGKLSKGTAEALKTASTQLSNEEAESNLTGRVAVDVGNDVGYINDIGKTLNVYHDTESGTDVITVEVERNGMTETVGIDELAFHNTEVAQAVENATDFIQDVNASDEQKTGIIKSFLQGYLQYASNGSSISLKDYTAGFKFLFEAGANGQSIMSVSENVSSAMKGILDRMNVAQKSLAIFAGQNSQVINGKLSSSAEFKSNISAAKRESMSAEERKNLETNEAFLGQLSRWVGKSVTLEEKVFGSDGEEVNAFYDPETDSYKISLNATEDAVAYIAIHETIHDIRVNNKEGFLELARVTLRVLEEHRAGSASRYNKYLESLYGELSQEDILEEVIANTVPVILRNKSTREALADRMAYSENRKARNAFVKLIEGASKFFAQCATRLSQNDKVSFSQFNDGIESDRKACEDILDAYTKAIEGIHKEAVDTVKNSGVKYSKTSIRNAAISYLEDKIRFSKKKEALHKATMTLFSGSGLFEHGMPDHYIPYVACEFFEDVRKLYKANHPEVFSIENDVNTMDYAKYKGKVQHLHMSPCCQQFSPMNNKTEILKDNARDRQFAESCARAIAQVEAPTISIEQVKQYLGSESEAIILKALEENGYKIVRGIYNAADYGSYTSRERYWLLAAKDFQPVEPPKGIDTKKNWKQCLTDDIIDSMEDSTYPESWVEKAKNTPRIGGIGVTLENVPMDLIILGTQKGKGFRCAYADELCPTITASDHEARIIRPDGTVKKVRAVHLAKLMGLDNYVFQTNERTGKIVEGRNIHAIGNGIPTQMTNAFLMALENSADERLEQASAEASAQRFSKKSAEYFTYEGMAEEYEDTGVDSFVATKNAINLASKNTQRAEFLADAVKNAGKKGHHKNKKGESYISIGRFGSVAKVTDKSFEHGFGDKSSLYKQICYDIVGIAENAVLVNEIKANERHKDNADVYVSLYESDDSVSVVRIIVNSGELTGIDNLYAIKKESATTSQASGENQPPNADGTVKTDLSGTVNTLVSTHNLSIEEFLEFVNDFDVSNSVLPLDIIKLLGSVRKNDRKVSPYLRYSKKSQEDLVNQSVTMSQAKNMIHRAFNANNLKDWYEGEYKNADEWAAKADPSEIALYIDNTEAVSVLLNGIQEIYDGDVTTEEIVEAYRAGTLTGKVTVREKIDLQSGVQVADDRFYSPKKIEDAQATYEIACGKATGANKENVIKARAAIVLYAHNRGASETLGLTDAELNKKLRSWTRLPADAIKIAQRINSDVADGYRWAGLENLTWINQSTVSTEDIERMVKSVDGKVQDYEKHYIARTMLAIDTHADWSWLKFRFGSSAEVNEAYKGGRVKGVAGYFNHNENEIVTTASGETVAHEMGHALDCKWGDDIYEARTGKKASATHSLYSTEQMAEGLTGDYATWFKHLQEFNRSLAESSDIRNEYYSDAKETFARFVSWFVSKTEQYATGSTAYTGYDSYVRRGDTFTQSQYVQFVNLLQEKAKLDSEKAAKTGSFAQADDGVRFSKKSQEDPRVTSIIERTNEVRNELTDVRNQMKDIENSDAFKDVVQDYRNPDIDAVSKFFRTSGYDDLATRKKNLQEELNKLSKQYDELHKEIALSEEREAIEKSGLSEQDWRRKQAIKEFGYTPYYYDAGYMLPDGKLLNFSSEKGRHFGSRGQDHRGISAVYATYDNLSDTMIDFMNGGNIRIMDESPGIDISNVTELTAAQYAGIRKYARTKLADDMFYVDFSDERGHSIGNIEYEEGTSADRVVADIKRFFETGKVPEEDTVASFHQRFSKKSQEVKEDNRKFINYNDEEARDKAIRAKHSEMVASGKYVEFTEDDLNAVKEYYPDLRAVKKSERNVLLRKAQENMFDDMRSILYKLLIDSGYSVELDAAGTIYVARAYANLADHAVPHSKRNHMQQVAAMSIVRAIDIVSNMEYVYSATHDQHTVDKADVKDWDYFYIPVKYNDDTSHGVCIAVRNMEKRRQDDLHQMYGWENKNSLGEAGTLGKNPTVSGIGSSAVTDSIGDNEPTVNTTGSKIRESRKSSVAAIESVMLENEKMKDYIGSAQKLARLGITATDKQASLTQARWVASEVKTMFGATMSGEDIAKEIVKAYTPIAKGSDDADAIMAANDALMDLAMRIAQSSKNSYRPAQEQYDTLKSFTDHSVIQLTATQVEDVKHKYGSIAEFNRKLFLAGTSMRVTITKSKTAKSTIDMDAWYHAMTDTPEGMSLASLLPADANEGDQPSLILEALETYGEKAVAGEWEKLGMTVDEYAGEIYGTLAEKAVEAKLESSKELAKNRTAEAMQDVDAEHQAELDAMQAELDKMAEEKAKWKEQLSKEYAEGYDAAKAEVGRRIADLEEAITMLKEESSKKLDEKLSKQKAEDKLKYKQAVDKLKSKLMKLRDQMKTNQQRDAELLRFTTSLIGTEKHLGEWRKNLAVDKLKTEFRTAIAQAMDGNYKGMIDAVTSYTRGMQGIRNQLMGLEKKGIREGKLAEKQAEHHRKTRAKIAATVKDLASRLVAGNDRTAIPEVAREPITQFVSLFTDDTTRKGILNKKQASQIVGKLAKWYDAIDVNGKDVKSVKNQADLRNLLGWMYDIDISQDLADLEDALSDDDGATISLAKMDQETLDKVLRIAQHMKHIATHADEDIRKSGKRAKLSQLGMQAMRQAQTSHRKNKFWSKATKLFDNNITPYYFFKRMGGVWQDLYNDIDESTRTYVFEVEKASETVASIKDKYHWKDWSHKKGDTLTIKTLDGTEMALTREQALSIYATDRREMSDNYQQANHLRGEGIRLEGEEITKNHALTNENIAAINEWLTDEQKAYADAMVKYMSGPLADIGNETSIRMYGYKKYLEPYYFPFGSNRAELYEDLKGSEGKGNDDPRIKNASFTKRTTKFANSGLLISDFTNVCGNHISQMLLYSTMAESLENMNRVFNWQTPARDEKLGQTQSKISVKSVIENTYGANTADYIRDFMKDVNGGTSRDRRDIAGGWLLSAFKRSAVMASLSVTIQQPSAIGRALAFIDPKYFVGKNTGGFEQAKKYAYTAVLKEIGGFDVAMGRSMADRVVGGIYEESTLRKIDNWINDKAGKLPEKADEITWGAIWNAVKRETMAKHPELKGEELLQAAGRRFDQVINATQVYDNQLAKSGNMRANGFYMKAVTSFMAEPTVSFNMLYDAVASVKQNPTKENKKAGARAIGAVATAMVINSILKSIISALRHKKDDEPYIETYVSEFVGNIMDEANPFGMIPLGRDIFSLTQGYDVERADMSVVSDLVDSMKGFVNLANKEEPTAEEERKVWIKFIGSLSKFTSVPVANIWRDFEALVNSIAKPIIRAAKGEELPKPEKLGFEIGIEDAIAGFIPFTLYRTGNSEWKKKAEKALVSGDTDEFEHRMRMYEVNRNRNGKDADTDSWASEVIKSAKDKLSMAEEIEYLQEYAGKDGKKAYETAAKWETGTNSAYDRLYQAIGTDNYQKVFDDMAKAGYAEKDIRTQVKSYIRDSYKGKNDRAAISAEDAESKLVRYAGMTRDEAHSQVMEDNCYRTYGVEYDKADDAVLEGTLTMAQYRKILKVCGGKSDKDIDKAVEKLEKKLNK